jgi:hypothetical protein
MRFFSNDAKDTNDDESSTVPQQRSGSPWSDAPADNQDNAEYAARPAETSTAVDDREQVDLPLDEQGSYDRPDVNDSTVTSPDAPVNEPTDAEVAGSDHDPALRDEGDFNEPVAVDPVTEEPLDKTDEPADTTDDALATTDEPADRYPADRYDEPTDPGAVPADTTDTLNDGGIGDGTDERENEEVIENAEVSDTLLDAEPVESDGESSTYASASAADDTATSDDTVAEDPTPADVPETAPVVAAVPVAAAASETAPATKAAAKPGSVEQKSVESFFGADAAKGFQERWRDVQLRFVDSPKDATAEAAGLVDEAVDQLTASLKGQKDALLSDSEDTEKLRVELRGYRDILNKVLSL